MKKIVLPLVLILFILWCATGIYLVVFNFNIKEVAVIVENKIVEEKPKISKLSLVAVGDALIHDGVYNAGKISGGFDYKLMMSLIKDDVEKADLAFYNQEAILGGTAIGLTSYPRFNSPHEFGRDMIATGFNLVSRANNHTLDRGEAAILSSETFWKAQTDVYTAGSYITEEDRIKVNVKEVNGIKYTMLAYTTLTNGLTAPIGKDYYVDVYSDEKVKADIERIGNDADIIMISMHWGTEYTFTPTTEEYRIAQYLSGLGVDIIIGHHPHVVQPVQYVGSTLVIYSLGNLISAQTELMKKVGLMVSLDIEKTEFKGIVTTKISNVVGTILYNPSKSPLGKYIVYPFDKVDSTVLSNYENVYNTYSGYIKKDDAITIKPLRTS